MVHRDLAAADSPAPTPPGVPVDPVSPGDSIPTGRVLPGGLRVLDRLGSTPEGPLYRAEYPNGMEVALVVLGPEAGGGEPSSRERFRRATQIQHPNVAAVYAVGEMEEGSVYVVLEQLAGEPLSTLLAAGQVFALPEALDLALQVAAGLQAAHRAGFVHGNLSPETILVTPAAEEWSKVKLIGFNLDPDFQQGTKPSIPEEPSAAYASLERLLGYPPDERTDVYSLGAVLHHLLAGLPPDRGQVDGSVPRVARAVLDTALKPTPARRFQTISELEKALKRLTAVAGNRKRPMIRRALLVGAVGAGLALVTGGVWLLTGLQRRATSDARPVPVPGGQDAGRVEPGPSSTREAPPAPARAPPAARQGAPRQDASRQNALRVDAPRQDVPRTRSGPAESDRPPADASANLAPRASRPESTAPTRLADPEPDRSIETGRVATAAAPAPAAVEKPEDRQAEDSLETPEALGYVGEPPPSSVPNPPPDSTLRREPRHLEATPPIRTTEDPRPRAELARSEGLRQSIGDVLRLGIAEDVAEIRPGVLLVSLTPAAMQVPSVTYNLQRLYLAYSAATEYRDEVALELRHGRALYGRFTRDGLRQASSD